MVEIDYTFYVIVTLMFFIVMILFYQNVFKNKQKRTVKGVQEVNANVIIQSYEKTIEVLNSQIELITEESKVVKRRLAKEIGLNYERDGESSLVHHEDKKINSKNLEEHYEIDISNGVKLVKSMNLPFLENMDESKIPSLINNPMIKGKVWDYIKSHKDEMISMGVIIPKGQSQNITEQSTDSSSEKTEGYLKFNESNEKHMA